MVGKYASSSQEPDQAENGELQPYIDIRFPVSIESKNFYTVL